MLEAACTLKSGSACTLGDFGKVINLSVPQALHLKNVDND